MLTDGRASSGVWLTPSASLCSAAATRLASRAWRAQDRPWSPWNLWLDTPEEYQRGASFYYEKQHSLSNKVLFTGSLRGVQLNFRRKLRVLRAGKHRPEAALSPSWAPISRARAAAKVARLWRSKISSSSSVIQENNGLSVDAANPKPPF